MRAKLKRASSVYSRLRGNCIGLTGDLSGLTGDLSGLWGHCTGLTGDCSRLRGNCTRLTGDCSGLTGDLDACDITKEDRARGVDVWTLVEPGPAVPGKEVV